MNLPQKVLTIKIFLPIQNHSFSNYMKKDFPLSCLESYYDVPSKSVTK